LIDSFCYIAWLQIYIQQQLSLYTVTKLMRSVLQTQTMRPVTMNTEINSSTVLSDEYVDEHVDSTSFCDCLN